MTTDELAGKIKAKYPDYADMDNQVLVEKITAKHPEYKAQLDANYDTSLAGRDARISALGNTIADSAKQVGSTMTGDMSQFHKPLSSDSDNPVTASLSKLAQPFAGMVGPSRLSASISEPGVRAGNAVEEKIGPDHPIAGKVANFVTSAALDPQTYATEGMAEGLQGVGKAGVKGFSELVNDGLASISKWRYGANVPEKAAEIAKKAKFNLPAGTPEEIEKGVETVQNVLNHVKDKAGKVLNDAKSAIGIPTTIEEKEASLLAGNGVHGLGKHEINEATQAMLDSKTAEELSANIAQFKKMQASGTSDPKLTARVANALQDKVNQFVDWQKTGSNIEGVLKKQYKDLGDIVTDHAVGLQGAKGEMAKTLEVFNDLKNRLADPDKSGKAEQFLRNLFTSKSAASKDYLESLAKLEHMSGKPVLTDLFKQFAGEAYSKVSGSHAGIGAALGEIGTAVALGHPGAAALGVGAMGLQSPALMKVAGKANQVASKAAQAAIKSKLAKAGLTTGLVSLQNNSALQSLKDKMKN